MASWEIPERNGRLHGKIIELNGELSSKPCFEYQRVTLMGVSEHHEGSYPWLDPSSSPECGAVWSY